MTCLMMMVVMMMILLRGRVKGVIKWEVVMLKMTYLSFFLPSFLSFFLYSSDNVGEFEDNV